MGKKYFYTLDLIRFIAASIVSIFHLTWLSKSTESFMHWGWVGVQIFFVLSGFVILESARYGNATSFIRSRVLRLYPAAIVCSVISFIILLLNQGLSAGLFLKFVKSFLLFIKGPYLATAYWTLPIEIAFYLIIFIIIKFWSLSNISKVIIWMTSLSSTYIFLYSLHTFNLLNFPSLEFGYGPANMFLLRHGIYFSIGMIIYLYHHNQLTPSLKGMLYLACTAACLEILSRAREINNKIESIYFLESALLPTIVFSLFVFFMYLVVTKKEIIPTRYQNVLRVLGLSSYPIYLLHEVLGNSVKDMLFEYLQITDLKAVFIAYCLVIMVSVVIAQKIEPKARKLLQKAINSSPAKKLLV